MKPPFLNNTWKIKTSSVITKNDNLTKKYQERDFRVKKQQE